MGYAKNYGARSFNRGSKAMILYRQRDRDGVERCACGCGAALVQGDIEFHHVIPWELSHDSRPKNGAALTTACHRKRFPVDTRVIAKVRKLRKRHAGIKRKVRHPFPCGRASSRSKPIHGVPVPRMNLAQKHAATMRKRGILTQRAEA